ncbi:N utilization substance protein B [Actinorhabdospora filicis]|uniref:Transcription antitermination protein NusB n=1 Tax=Actinorhabdospora filicis TaxID=1785913 RepID=A0A9W6SH25_9ACTN|nr:transcription antitermination factor NusB [Actinorhabdospora filicis]GLZ75279.1 N utilization substance protein B [Actinorhabdospora filicis]
MTGDNAKSLGAFPARRKARKRAVDVLYEAEQRGLPFVEVLATRQSLADQYGDMPSIPEYTVTLVEGIATFLKEIDFEIAGAAHGWTLQRMPAVDRNILRVAVYELRHQVDVDVPVIISEAVKLAETLCSDDSPAFVNGVLNNIASGGA